MGVGFASKVLLVMNGVCDSVPVGRRMGMNVWLQDFKGWE